MSESPRIGHRPDVSATLRPVTQASHPPGVIYNDPAILEHEKEVVFRKDWLCIGRADEIPNPGDYLTQRIVGEPVLLCRKEDGSIAAYSNTCLHRGVEVASGQGNTKEFTCPYHGWLYNLEGQLLGASYMRDSEGFDRKNCRLPTLPVAVWQGWIFLSLNLKPEPFERYIADFDEKFGYIDMGKLKLGLKREIPLRCNWKLMVENFIDFYHVGILHKDTIGRFMKTSDVEYELRPGGRIFIDEYDAGSHTKDGQVFREPIATLKDKPARFSQAGVLPPNLNFFVRPDYIMVYTSWPTDVDHMVMRQYIVFPEHIRDATDFPEVIANFIQMSDKILGEDVDMVESLQNASKARHFVPGRMSRLEKGVQHFIRHNLSRIYGQDQNAEAAE